MEPSGFANELDVRAVSERGVKGDTRHFWKIEFHLKVEFQILEDLY